MQRPRSLPNTTRNLGDGPLVFSLRGGMRHGWTSWSYPLVIFRVFPSGVELGPSSRCLWPVVPLWRARFDEMSVVECIVRPKVRSAAGVLFRTEDESSELFLYWCRQAGDLLARLDQLGAPVDPTPRRSGTSAGSDPGLAVGRRSRSPGRASLRHPHGN